MQNEVSLLKQELEEKEVQLNGLSTGRNQNDGLTWLNTLSHDINENVEERINLQKALFELEDKNSYNHYELQQLDNEIAKHQVFALSNLFILYFCYVLAFIHDRLNLHLDCPDEIFADYTI